MSEACGEVIAYVALGSNLDDPALQVRRGLDALGARLPDARLLRHSRLYRTAPWGLIEQPDFINAVAELATSLSPRSLLEALLRIEREQGRERCGPRWGPRLIDLDLLLYDALQCEEPGLHLPHPRMAQRAFVLVPLAELAPHLSIPGQGTMAHLIGAIDTGCVHPVPLAD